MSKRVWRHSHGARFLLGADGPSRADEGSRELKVLRSMLRFPPPWHSPAAQAQWRVRWEVVR